MWMIFPSGRSVTHPSGNMIISLYSIMFCCVLYLLHCKDFYIVVDLDDYHQQCYKSH